MNFRVVRTGLRSFAALALGCLVHHAIAQSPPSAAGVTCDVSATPPILPAEGVAELMGDIVINCQGGTPTAAGQAIPQITWQIFVNTDITSHLVSTSPDLSEALLLIDDPAPQNQLVCPAPPCSIQGTGGGAGSEPNGPYNGSAGRYNIFQAAQISGNSLEWTGVPFDPPGAGRVRTLRITNVRAEVWPLANCTCLGPVQLFAFVTTVGPNGISFHNQQFTTGYFQSALRFSHTTATLLSSSNHDVGKTGPTPATDFTITFQEGFAGAFKPRTVAARPDDTSPSANQNTPGKVYPSASGFYNAGFNGTYTGAGLASQGTRLIAHFEHVPFGVSLFVTQQPITGSNIRVQLVSTGPEGNGAYDPIAPAANGFAPITVYDGSAVAVWEVLSASLADLESVQFGVAVSFAVDTTARVPGLGTATVRGSLAPLTDVRIASLTDPAPRYIEGVSQPAFTITDRGTPAVTAVVNAGSFASNQPLAPGSVAAIFGQYLTVSTQVNSSLPMPVSLGGTTVQINGIAAPIYATSPGQVNVEIPWELAGFGEGNVKVIVDGVDSNTWTIPLSDTAPYIFESADGQGLIARALPVGPGSTLTIYGTGFGPVQNPPATGSAAMDFTSTTINTPEVTIGGIAAEVVSSSLTPGLVGLYQVGFRIPESLMFGVGIPVTLSIAGVESNAVTINLP
jgi:uncharacterized protein (TIGR03437 family)